MAPSLRADMDRPRSTAPARLQPVGGRRRTALRLGGGAVAIWAGLSLIGLLFTHVISPNGPPAWDSGVVDRLAAHRTTALDTATQLGSGIANTQTVIVVTLAVMLLLRWRLGRWYESWVVVAAIIGELVVFVAITATVHRDRPTVVRLDAAPPTSSFPSGHTAAAVALYGCLAILLLKLWPGVAARLAATLLFAIPVVVGLSRLYRGMHFPTDVLFGALGGGLWLSVVVTTLLAARRPRLHAG